jgi:phosphatidylglycerol:prolipoprotein diacylglycerol transferase
VFPRLLHIGNFNLPTYGFLVSMGVLIGLWISVRNSEKQGIDRELAWNLGRSVRDCGRENSLHY